MVWGRVCDHMYHFGYHIEQIGLLKAWGAAMLKGSGENTDMYMWHHCCMLMYGHARTTLSCQSHDMLNLCVPESRGQVLGMRLISMLHVNSRLWAPNPSKMRMEKGHLMMNLPLQLTIHNWMMTIRKTSRLITSLQSQALLVWYVHVSMSFSVN